MTTFREMLLTARWIVKYRNFARYGAAGGSRAGESVMPESGNDGAVARRTLIAIEDNGVGGEVSSGVKGRVTEGCAVVSVEELSETPKGRDEGSTKV